MAGAPEEDVNFLKFGTLSDGDHLSNATVATLLQSIRAQSLEEAPTRRLPEAFEKALQHATRFCGAVGTKDYNAIDALQEALLSAELLTTIADDGTELKDRLAQYEVVVLMNLNPSSVSAAKSLVPSLNRFADDAIEEVIKILRAASAASVAASAGGGGATGSAMADE